jgi:RNA polymerase sigma factor (sigma-70 family)
MQYFKKEKRIEWDNEPPEFYETIDLQAIEAENTEILETQIKTLAYCFEGLKEEYSIILSMRYYADMSIKNISNTLQIGESAVKMRLKRGREMLATCVQPKI